MKLRQLLLCVGAPQAPASTTRRRPPLRGWSPDGVPAVLNLLSTVMFHLCSDHTTHLSDKSFITHMLYKNTY